MARINLLPWRAERRKLRQKEFMTMLGVSALGAVLLSFLIVNYYNRQIDGENARIAFVKDQIAKVDQQITEIELLDQKKAKLLARKDVIEQLQANRSQMVHLFDELVRTIPDGVRLTSVKQDGDKLTLVGQSQSNARVSAYMRNIETSGWMTSPDLSVIRAEGNDKTLPYVFTLSLTLTKPGQVIGPDGKPVLGPDGKPMVKPASGASVAPASSASVPMAAPVAPAPAPAAASKKGGATP